MNVVLCTCCEIRKYTLIVIFLCQICAGLSENDLLIPCLSENDLLKL